MRISTPRRRVRHRIQMHVEQVLRRSAHRIQTHRTGTMVNHFNLKTGQLRADVIEDAAFGTDRTRWIAGVEGHQLFQMFERLLQHD